MFTSILWKVEIKTMIFYFFLINLLACESKNLVIFDYTASFKNLKKISENITSRMNLSRKKVN